jgi:hypothetical protein
MPRSRREYRQRQWAAGTLFPEASEQPEVPPESLSDVLSALADMLLSAAAPTEKEDDHELKNHR